MNTPQHTKKPDKGAASGREQRLVRRLSNFQKWRRGANIKMPDPKEIGETIDGAIRNLRITAKFLDWYDVDTLAMTPEESDDHWSQLDEMIDKLRASILANPEATDPKN